MSYVPTTWNSNTLISARRLRHIEEQYDEAKSYFDAHVHDDRYYTESEADAKFFHLSGGDTLPSGLDADTIDGQHATDLIGAGLPIGTIVPSKGTDGDVPSGWAICNGGNGTPDLRDKFVVGAGNTYNVGDTGGSLTATPSGSITVAVHALTIDEIPSHRHQYTDGYGNDRLADALDQNNYYADASGASEYTGYAGSGDAHGHPGSDWSLTSGAEDNRPPYYALYYIKKVS